MGSVDRVDGSEIPGLSFEESQPDQRPLFRMDVRNSNQRSQSTRDVIGLEISGLFALVFRCAFCHGKSVQRNQNQGPRPRTIRMWQRAQARARRDHSDHSTSSFEVAR
jgi:hypothetical protein